MQANEGPTGMDKERVLFCVYACVSEGDADEDHWHGLTKVVCTA